MERSRPISWQEASRTSSYGFPLSVKDASIRFPPPPQTPRPTPLKLSLHASPPSPVSESLRPPSTASGAAALRRAGESWLWVNFASLLLASSTVWSREEWGWGYYRWMPHPAGRHSTPRAVLIRGGIQSPHLPLLSEKSSAAFRLLPPPCRP